MIFQNFVRTYSKLSFLLGSSPNRWSCMSRSHASNSANSSLSRWNLWIWYHFHSWRWKKEPNSPYFRYYVSIQQVIILESDYNFAYINAFFKSTMIFFMCAYTKLSSMLGSFLDLWSCFSWSHASQFTNFGTNRWDLWIWYHYQNIRQRMIMVGKLDLL